MILTSSAPVWRPPWRWPECRRSMVAASPSVSDRSTVSPPLRWGFQIQGEMASFQIGVTSSGGETGASAGVGFQF